MSILVKWQFRLKCQFLLKWQFWLAIPASNIIWQYRLAISAGNTGWQYRMAISASVSNISEIALSIPVNRNVAISVKWKCQFRSKGLAISVKATLSISVNSRVSISVNSRVSISVCLKCVLLPDDWIVDSGCTKHMTRNRRLFTSYKAYNGGHVIFGSNLKGKVVGGGNITHDSITITNVEHVSGLAFNLINVGYSQTSKAYIVLNKETMRIEESLNVTFDESLPEPKSSSLVEDDRIDEPIVQDLSGSPSLQVNVLDEGYPKSLKEARGHPNCQDQLPRYQPFDKRPRSCLFDLTKGGEGKQSLEAKESKASKLIKASNSNNGKKKAYESKRAIENMKLYKTQGEECSRRKLHQRRSSSLVRL
ncbi:hypothetical protein Tco_0273861 [Tanacetum coccineum]